MQLNVLLLPGDGIGTEVTREAVKVLEKVAQKFHHELKFSEGLLGGIAIHKTGTPLPEETVELAKKADATFLGAVGLPEFDNIAPEKRPERGLLGIRKALGVYANLRPVRAYAALIDSSPLKNHLVEGTDMIIVRELTGGIYYGTPRGISGDGAEERAVNTMSYTRSEIERVARMAFYLAANRRKKVTSVDKSNVLENSQLWRKVVTELAAKEFPDIELDHLLVDNCAMQLVLNPKRFDVLVTENMFGDILSDEGAVLAGSIGMLPSASIGERKSSGVWVGLYEPVHGSAPDIAGQNKANPFGAIGSAAALLEYSFGLKEEAAAVNRAVEEVLNSGRVTADLKPKGAPGNNGAGGRCGRPEYMNPRTIIEKVWDNHVVAQQPGAPALIYIDLHLVHEVTSPQAFEGLRQRGLKVRRPDLTIATTDHSTPTTPRSLPILDKIAATQVAQLESNCQAFGIKCFGFHSPDQGIVHVIGPEQGLTQPGMTVVCGDSHTATHGAFGALAFGIGTSEVEHVLATQCLLQRRSKTFKVQVDGALKNGVSAKDIILALIARIGIGGGTASVFEYCGSAIRSLSMEERMTVCNMSIEGGARAGMVAPDDNTYQYIAGRHFAPKGAEWDAAVSRWKQLPSDEGATYDKEITIDAAALEPMITFGTNPGMGISITEAVPDPADLSDPMERDSLAKALRYMDLPAGKPLLGHKVNVVFIGSCTNSRISDLRSAAGILKGRKVSPNVRVMVVPGSQHIKEQAQAEGLDVIFKQAGADWREAGCSMCIAMNGDQLSPGEYSVSTSNRNFEGRQGKGGRTFLASPLTAAASAITGVVTDVRTLLS